MTEASGSPRRTSTFDIRRLTDDVRSVVIAVPAVAVGAVAVGAVAVGTGLTSVGATIGEASTHCMELATAQLTAGNEASSAPAAAVEPGMADNGDDRHHASVLHIPSPPPRPRVVRLNDEGAVQDAEDENDEVRREWLNVSDIFNSMDADGSGDVDRRELEQVVVSQGYSPEVATLLMEELDANDDGKLTLDEVREGLKYSSFAAGRPPVRKDYTPSLAASLYFIVGAVVYGQLEGWGALDSCYFLMYTCTTVGYGELTPVTGAGRLFTAVYALLGMTLVFSALAPLVEALQELIDRFEQHVTGWLEEHGWLAPAIDPLDITLSSKEVKQISYARRYVLALFNPFIIMITGMLLAVVVVPEGGWSDRFYWVIISMTTIGYGDITPTSPVAKVLVSLFLPVSVVALGQALTDVSAIALRRSIREEDYGERIMGELLREECSRRADPDESLTEAEFLVAVLIRRNLVDASTIAAVRRQFREMVKDDVSEVPIEKRDFDSRLLFTEALRRGQIKQRAPNISRGTMIDGGKIALVDLNESDGGYAEWLRHFWVPRVEAGMPPTRKQSLDPNTPSTGTAAKAKMQWVNGAIGGLRGGRGRLF